ncbi:conodipine-P3-like [Saccostrea cucullata]|uniref:conodipine-P3-like n=1 Tax=Saccostrea cuccullata TaxID=36930 RepID=UPI002ED31C74
MKKKMNSSHLTFIILLLLSVVCVCLSQTCAIPLWTNGCSVPLHLPFFYKDKFTTSCNHHDVCYHCGYTYGIPRETCDINFLRKMLRQCNVSNRKRLCKYFAKLDYNVVRNMAVSHYSREYRPQCLHPLALPCLE